MNIRNIGNDRTMEIMYRGNEKYQSKETNVLMQFFYLLFQYMRLIPVSRAAKFSATKLQPSSIYSIQSKGYRANIKFGADHFAIMPNIYLTSDMDSFYTEKTTMEFKYSTKLSERIKRCIPINSDKKDKDSVRKSNIICIPALHIFKIEI
jgi:hypothetical protein